MRKNWSTALVVVAMIVGVWAIQKYTVGADNVSANATAYDDKISKVSNSTTTAGSFEFLTQLEYAVLPEASGMAVSGLDPNRLWLINDSGSRSELIALDLEKPSFVRVNIVDTRNRDWEDLEVFEYDGRSWIVVADVGDNDARRQQVALHFLPEPSATEKKAQIHSTIRLSYPDGPRDVESLAVDPLTNRIYLLSKRDPFPKLYSMALPKLGAKAEFQINPVLLGEVRSIPAPSATVLKQFAKYGKYRSQPTGMSHVPDGSGVVLQTYGSAYFAPLDAERNWLRALNESLCPVPHPALKQAESIAADRLGRIYVTSEGRKAPLLRLTPGSDCLL